MTDDMAGLKKMKTVAFVPVRLNSKRVPGKNLKLLGGKPLMCHVLETLAAVSAIDEVYVYCSSDEVLPCLPPGVKLLKRPAELDRDETLGAEIYDAFTREVEADVYVLAHTTSPFLRRETVERALEQILDGSHDSAFSCERVQTFVWYEGRPLNYSLTAIPRTQTIEPVYVETSAFYMFRREVWTRLGQRIGTNPYMAVTDRLESVDIDWPEDFRFAERVAGE